MAHVRFRVYCVNFSGVGAYIQDVLCDAHVRVGEWISMLILAPKSTFNLHSIDLA